MLSRLRQPLLGVAATAVVIVVSLVFVSLFSWPTFGGWVSFALMCAIPVTIVIGAFWRGAVPAAIAERPQPVRGLLFLGLAAAVAVVVAVVHLVTIGGGVTPPVPMVIQAIITSVVVTFFLAIVWGGWPWSLVRNKLVAGVGLLATAYVVNAVLYSVLFNYEFAKGAPFYQPSLDPGGLFNAWDVTVFAVTALAVMFLFLHLDLWPLTRFGSVMRQPVLGIVWTLATVVIGGALFWLGTRGLGMAAPVFLVRVPIPFIFGSVILLNMLQGSLFRGMRQPVKGLVGAAAAAVAGSLLALGYALLMPLVTGELGSGAPGFDAELWLANALLAVTFPAMAWAGDFFGLWPLAARGPAPEAGRQAEPVAVDADRAS
ncbi:hypothetical protein [Intrasporangium calvum]|uniref:Uncharacterized protein n=1 Tax=Intrasporangium calvum (strain ATCC 23552 / DSM 43043 / JCM 3097 / NBRC 12989 / NCIMB 10167 / NRRL B-3866 / 7 KIP) TaxID=710696 RepID=E6SE47_INTC7|nr:hypothetical protein [Intrasporangium calvum]ADU48695.1 hypothetical protein Intca_2186 [Intrasporangium calvum DSM 43043]